MQKIHKINLFSEKGRASAKDLCQFLEAAVTHSYTLDDLKQQEFVISQFQRTEVRDQVVSRAIVPPEALVENPLPLPVNGGTRHSLAYDCITPVSSVCPHIAVSVCFLLCVSNKDTFLALGPTHIIEDYLTWRPLISLHLQRSFFQIRLQHRFKELEGHHYLFRGCHSTIYRL